MEDSQQDITFYGHVRRAKHVSCVNRRVSSLEGKKVLEIRQLQVFLAVWKKKSFSKATQEVNLTQPTISGHIKSLENTIGTKLFDRSGRDVIPTKAGHILYPYAKKIIQLQKQAQKELALFQKGDQGNLEIGGSNIPGQYILPELVGKFKENHKDIKVNLKVSDTHRITEAISIGDIEIGIVGAILNYPDLKFNKFLDDELVLICPPKTNPISEDEIEIEKLKQLPFIVREAGSGTRTSTEKQLKKILGFSFSSFNIVAEFGSNEAIKQAVKAGIGCAIVSKRSIEDDVRFGRLRIISIKGVKLYREFYLVHHNSRTLSPLAEAFMKFLKDTIPST